jgi:ketosteroid isomerase-like protein
MGTPAENKEIVARHVRNFPSYTAKALETGDPSHLAVDFTDDFFWAMPSSIPRGGVHAGMPAVLQFLKDGLGLFEHGTMQTELVGMIAEDDQVAVRINCTARSSKGRDYANQYHILFRIRGDKICELWDFQDTRHFWQACYAD